MTRSGGPQRPVMATAILGLPAWQAAFIGTPPAGSGRGHWTTRARSASRVAAAAAGDGSEPVAKQRRVWLKDASNDRLYDVWVEQDVIGVDLRRAAKPKFDDEDLALVTLRKADGAELNLEEPVPDDVGDTGKSAVKVEVLRPRSDAGVLKAPSLLQAFNEEAFNFTSVVNNRINNKLPRPFLERGAVIDEIIEELRVTEADLADKPRVVVLWSPRGTGKTSVVRHLALECPQLEEQRSSGRLLVMDAKDLPDRLDRPKELLMAMIVFHILDLLHNSSVKLAEENIMNFRMFQLTALVDVICGVSKPVAMSDDLFEWIQNSCRSMPGLFNAWVEVTKAAFGTDSSCKPVIVVDQAEMLVRPSGTDAKSSFGGRVSLFTRLCSFLPLSHASVWLGTLDVEVDAPAEQYTLLLIKSLQSLPPLSAEAAQRMMSTWGGRQYPQDVLNQIIAYSCGVPRLLQYAFQGPRGCMDTAQVAFDEMSKCFDESYKQSASRMFQDEELGARLVLCAATKWPTTATECVPGTTIRWGDIFHAAAAFPERDTIVIPRLWWPDVDAIRRGLQKLKLHLDDLVPDPIQLLKQRPGASEAGVPWERMIANCLAGRFHLHCLANGLDCRTAWANLTAVYPTTEEHARRVLEPFEVCICDGVHLPQEELFADGEWGKAIICNPTGAHHDVLIPVRHKDSGQEEYIAMQCRYGALKDASRLKEQDKVRKGDKDSVGVLLQCCSSYRGDGKQNFRSTEWQDRQERKRYAVISGECICAFHRVFQLLSMPR